MTQIPTLLRIGTRGSPLALWQAQHVQGLLMAAYPQLTCQIEVIITQGDRDRTTPLPAVGGKGLFTEDIEARLHSGAIDLAVHSLKDMPTVESPGLSISAVPLRGPHRDVLVSRHGTTLAELPAGAVIGTSSTRRSAQVRGARPDARLVDIRGNIDTRIQRALDPNGPYDAILLAEAGVVRLGLERHVSEYLTVDSFVPAPAQGALGIQTRSESPAARAVASISDPYTARAVVAERAVLHELALGCSAPIAAYAWHTGGDQYAFIGRAPEPDGQALRTVAFSFAATDTPSAVAAGIRMAHRLRGAE